VLQEQLLRTIGEPLNGSAAHEGPRLISTVSRMCQADTLERSIHIRTEACLLGAAPETSCPARIQAYSVTVVGCDKLLPGVLATH
jgi:hypothetical protein